MDGPPNILNFDLMVGQPDETGVAPAKPAANPPARPQSVRGVAPADPQSTQQAGLNFVDLLNIGAAPPARPSVPADLSGQPRASSIPRADSNSVVRPVSAAPVAAVVVPPQDAYQTITSAIVGQDSRMGLSTYPVTERTSRFKVPMSERIVERVAEASQLIHLVDLWYTICHSRGQAEVIKSPGYLKLESLKELILIPLKEELADLYSKSKQPRVVTVEPVGSLREDVDPFTPSNSALFSNPDPMVLFDRGDFVDGRGGWTVFFKLLKYSLKRLVPLAHLLVFSDTPTKFLADSALLWNDLEHLLEMLRLMKRITFMNVSAEEIEGLSMIIKIPPFWYQCGQGKQPTPLSPLRPKPYSFILLAVGFGLVAHP